MKQLIYETGLLEKKPIGITNGNLTLTECDPSEADEYIIKYHYSHKATSNRFLSLRVNEGKDTGGYIQLGYGIRPAMKHTISSQITKDNYCEFDRMWLSDDLPRFSESQVIALLLSYLRQVYKKIKFVITYADSTAGNKGTIYKATNAIVLEPIKADLYILSNGERVHPVTMWHRHKTRAWDVMQKLYPGITKPKGVQFRFLYILDRKAEKAYRKESENKTFAEQVSKKTRTDSIGESEVKVLGSAPISQNE